VRAVDESRAHRTRELAGAQVTHAAAADGARDAGQKRAPPRLGVGEVGMRLVVAVPGEAVLESVADDLDAAEVSGLPLVEHLEHARAPETRTERERTVEVPQHDPRCHSRCGVPRASRLVGSTRMSGASTIHGKRGTVE
jgi:hypothetical protein